MEPARRCSIQFLLICVFCVVCGELAVTELAAAQGTAIIRGEVIQADGATRAPGVVVVAVDTAGTEVTRALSGAGGNYSLSVRAPARYVLRALRIGFRPTVLPAIDVVAGELRAIDVELSGQAIQLEAVRVEGESTCRMNADAGRQVVNLWDQVRTALAASTLSSGGRPYEATLATFRQFTPRGERVVQAETVTVVKRTTTAGFVSVPAESLAVHGYFVQRGTQYAYHSPDANVLLSPEFAAAHCFRVLPGGPAHPDWIGIGFRPAALRTRIADVDGALWVDRATAELRRLEYKYVNLPPSSGWEDADGSVTFVRLLTGDWIIERWAIRTPVTEERVGARSGPRFVVLGSRVVGGVTRAINRDGMLLRNDPGASLTLVLRARDTVNTPAGGHVVLYGTEHEAYADENGVARLDGLNAGRFRALIWTPLMGWLGIAPLEQEVGVSVGDAGRVEVTLPKAEEVAARRCRISATANLRLLYGKVLRPSGAGVRGARVVLNVRSGAAAGTPPPAGRRRNAGVPPPLALGEYEAVTDEHGQWQLCTRGAGVVQVSVVMDGGVATARSVTVHGAVNLTRADFTIP